MEDPVYAVSKQNDIIYKQILTPDECKELNNEWMNMPLGHNIGTSLATGQRFHTDIDLNNYPDIVKKLYIVLDNYYLNLEVLTDARFYSHLYGGIKRHTDENHDNRANYTLLIYLTDDFDDGKLSIQNKRTLQEREEHDYDMKHNVFTINPKTGYGVIFKKSYVHWANEVYTGNKNFLLIHLYVDE